MMLTDDDGDADIVDIDVVVEDEDSHVTLPLVHFNAYSTRIKEEE